MPYTNVFISGTNIGTMAFTDGFYILRGLRPGTYTVKASYISYGVGSRDRDPGPGRDRQHRLPPRGQGHHGRALRGRGRARPDRGRPHRQRPLPDGQRAWRPCPWTTWSSMIAQQPGVTLQDNEIHIRGGRADDTSSSSTACRVNDPLAGGGYGYQHRPLDHQRDRGADRRLQRRVRPGRQRRRATSSTKEGSDRVEGRVSLQARLRDQARATRREYAHWRDLTDFDEPQNIDILKISMSGPDPISAGLRAAGPEPAGQAVPAGQRLAWTSATATCPSTPGRTACESPVYEAPFWSPRQQNDWNGLAEVDLEHHADPQAEHQRQPAGGGQPGLHAAGRGLPAGRSSTTWTTTLVFTNENILTQVYYRQVLGETSWYELTAGPQLRPHARQPQRQRRLRRPIRPSRTTPTGRDAPAARPTATPTAGTTTTPNPGPARAPTRSWAAARQRVQDRLRPLVHRDAAHRPADRQLGNPPPGKLAIGEDVFMAHPIIGAAYLPGHRRLPRPDRQRGPARRLLGAGPRGRARDGQPGRLPVHLPGHGRGVLRQHRRPSRAGAGRRASRRGWVSASRSPSATSSSSTTGTSASGRASPTSTRSSRRRRPPRSSCWATRTWTPRSPSSTRPASSTSSAASGAWA